MSVCTFIASNCPLKEVAPDNEYPLDINLDNGTIDDGGADDNFFLLPFENVCDYTKKYIMRIFGINQISKYQVDHRFIG